MKRFDHCPSTFPALLLGLMLLPGLVGASALERLFAPDAELWPRWQAHAADDARVIDHATWDRFLKTYVKRSGDGMRRVAYAAVSDSDRQALDAYIDSLAGSDIDSYARAQQFAYWVNLYNALTVQVVLDHYPVASIRDIDISPGLFADGPWKKKLVTINGESVGLDDIEHRILRPIWRDPRIHYAVNCASVGCPDLQPEAFTAANSERLLDRAAADYVNHPRGVSVDQGRVTASSIYNWFKSDFEVDGGVLAHIRRHADPALRAKLDGIGAIDSYQYDWSLNDLAAPEG
ncbi:MAG: DUF547 domain-containing protein [Gammaproteobacteria bacterium]|nr:DUF547 domain-containing protein [Gammaproteobacteria bacterium]